MKQIYEFKEWEAWLLYGCTWTFYLLLGVSYCILRKKSLYPIQANNWLAFLPLISLLFESISVLLQYFTFINPYAITCYFILNVGPANFLWVAWLCRFYFAARLKAIFGGVTYKESLLNLYTYFIIGCYIALLIVLYVDLHVTNKELWNNGDCSNLIKHHKFDFYPYLSMIISTLVDLTTCILFIYPFIKTKLSETLSGSNYSDNLSSKATAVSNVSDFENARNKNEQIKNMNQTSLIIITMLMCVFQSAVSLANNIAWFTPPINVNLIFADSMINGISPLLPTIIQFIVAFFVKKHYNEQVSKGYSSNEQERKRYSFDDDKIGQDFENYLVKSLGKGDLKTHNSDSTESPNIPIKVKRGQSVSKLNIDQIIKETKRKITKTLSDEPESSFNNDDGLNKMKSADSIADLGVNIVISNDDIFQLQQQ